MATLSLALPLAPREANGPPSSPGHYGVLDDFPGPLSDLLPKNPGPVSDFPTGEDIELPASLDKVSLTETLDPTASPSDVLFMPPDLPLNVAPGSFPAASFLRTPFVRRDDTDTTVPITVVSTELLPAGKKECKVWRVTESAGVFSPSCRTWGSDPDGSTTDDQMLELWSVKLTREEDSCAAWHVEAHHGYVEPICGRVKPEAVLPVVTAPFKEPESWIFGPLHFGHGPAVPSSGLIPREVQDTDNMLMNPSQFWSGYILPKFSCKKDPCSPHCLHKTPGVICPIEGGNPEQLAGPEELTPREDKPETVYDPAANVGPVGLPSVAPLDQLVDGIKDGGEKLVDEGKEVGKKLVADGEKLGGKLVADAEEVGKEFVAVEKEVVQEAKDMIAAGREDVAQLLAPSRYPDTLDVGTGP
ncbi:hypothetical protein LTR12_006433 [Friedmanniomyces endolithicus]|nr:hypothetical protein LTR12_006433 [Friedmanniomyces endolithicus]